MKFSLFKTACTVLTMTSGVQAWWDKGNLLVSRIAYNILNSTESAGTISSVENLLGVLKKSHPELTKKEDKHPLVECATFADDWKNGTAYQYQESWHFVQQPWLDQGGNISDFNFTAQPHNITEALKTIVQCFHEINGDNTNCAGSYIYQQIRNHPESQTDQEALSTMMRLLIHYVSAIHQPMNTITRINKDYPEGDNHGHSLPIAPKDNITELHEVWDSVLYKYEGEANLPYSDKDWDAFGQIATDLYNKYDIEDPSSRDLNIDDWATESYYVAKLNAYPGANRNAILSDDYVTNGQEVAEIQIVKAGHRLANLLKSFGLFEENDEFLKTSDEPQIGLDRAFQAINAFKAKLWRHFGY